MAYTASVTLDLPRPFKLHGGVALVTGKADITSYHTTGAEITDITDFFISMIRVICDGFSDNGYLVRWNTTDLCFHAYYPFYAGAGSETAGANNTLCKTSTGGPSEVGGTGTAYGQPGVECADDLDVGEVNFIAIGLTS